MIDTNVYLSHWPFRRLPGDDLDSLVTKLSSKGVSQAWVGSFDALLHRDVAAVNARLAKDCQGPHDIRLVPFGVVNPNLPDWKDDLRRCHETHKMPGIRLHPNYHGYKLDDLAFVELLKLATTRGLVVQIALRMEDPRTQHALLTVPDVDASPLVKLLGENPQARVQLLNGLSGVRADSLDKLVAAGKLYLDIATLEGVEGIQKLLSHVPQERVLFGSYFPFFAWEAAELKLRESNLGEAQRKAIGQANAEMLLRKSSRSD